MRYVVLFLGSFALVFAGTYLYVTRIEYPGRYGGSSNSVDSTQVTVKTDTVKSTNAAEKKTTENSTTSSSKKRASLKKGASLIPAPSADAATIYQPETSNKEPKEETSKPKISFVKLARLYSVMRPQVAASALSKLDDDVVIGILSKMEERKAARILAAMGPDRAADLTAKMLSVKRKGI